MSHATTLLDTIQSSQAGKEITANALFDAMSSGATFGRRSLTTAGLTWGYYGGAHVINGVPTLIPNGTVTLASDQNNYIELNESTGAVVVNPTGWTGTGFFPLYKVLTGPTTVSDYWDYRSIKGPKGTPGVGSYWLKGSGAPDAGIGTDFDYYLDVVAGDVYFKEAGSWGTAVINLKGPAGPSTALQSIYATFPGSMQNFVGTLRWYPRTDITVTNVSVSMSTAPALAPAVFNVRKNGTVIFSDPNKPTVAIGQNLSASNPTATTLTPSDYLTVDVEIPNGGDAVLRIDYQ